MTKKTSSAPPSSVSGTPVSQQQLQFQRYMPVYERRQELTPEEQAKIQKGKKKIIPKIFPSQADSPDVMMSSPVVPAVGSGLIAAVPGAVFGANLAGLIAGEDEIGPRIVGAGIGAITTGLLGSFLSYKSRKSHNETLEESMRRMPPGGTIRDMASDPVYQANLDRQATRESYGREYNRPQYGWDYNPGLSNWG